MFWFAAVLILPVNGSLRRFQAIQSARPNFTQSVSSMLPGSTPAAIANATARSTLPVYSS
jgi:hypothetical protein